VHVVVVSMRVRTHTIYLCCSVGHTRTFDKPDFERRFADQKRIAAITSLYRKRGCREKIQLIPAPKISNTSSPASQHPAHLIVNRAAHCALWRQREARVCQGPAADARPARDGIGGSDRVARAARFLVVDRRHIYAAVFRAPVELRWKPRHIDNDGTVRSHRRLE
jgi:hypothetical protein